MIEEEEVIFDEFGNPIKDNNADVGGLAVYSDPNVQKAMTKLEVLAKQQKDRYDAQALALKEKRYGPSFSERMFQLSAALASPTQSRGFGGVMANVAPVLAAQAQAKRAGEISRREALEQLNKDQLEQQLGLAKQGLTTSIAMAKINQEKPSKVVGNTIINGVPSVIMQDDDGNVTTKPLAGEPAGGSSNKPSRTGTTETRGGVVGYYDENGVWKPLPQRPVQETFRDATPEEAAARGAKSGQVSNLTGLFKPDAVAKPRELKPKEIQMLTDAEQAIASGQQAIRDFTRALEINPTAYSGALATTRQGLGSALGSSDPAYLATEEYANLTTQNALNALKTTFGSNPTEGERKILLEVQGSVSKPPAVRERILRRAMEVAQRVVERNTAMIPRIQGGYYSTRTDGSQGKPAAGKPRVINWNN